MKRIVKIYFLLVALMIATTSLAVTFRSNGIYYEIENGKVVVTSSKESKYSGNIVIPRVVKYKNRTYKVTKIGENAFYGCSGLTLITLPNSITEIGGDAFRNCTGLTKVTIPNSVTSIGAFAFRGCSGLTSIVIPNSVISIGCMAFHDTPWFNIQSDGVIYINNVFYGYKGIIPSSINIKEGTVCIPEYSFIGCPSLRSITMPNTITKLKPLTFDGCSGLTRITIPNSVTEIGSSVFRGCTGLTSITIPNSVTKIGLNAFNMCTGLTSIIIEDGLIPLSLGTIGGGDLFDTDDAEYLYHVFDDCPLESLYLGRNISYNMGKKHGFSPFSQKNTLKTVTIGNSVTAIGCKAFFECTGLSSITIPNSVTEIGNYAFKGCRSLTNVILPTGLKKIGYETFEDCTSLDTIIIPNSVTEIGNSVFEGCSGLRSVVIPNSVTEISQRVFYNCTSLTSISIPDSVTEIRNYAFKGCRSLTNVILPTGLKKIGYATFKDCASLDTIIIPNSVIEIGENAFEGCTNLKKVTFLNPETKISKNAFYNCPELPKYYNDGIMLTAVEEKAKYPGGDKALMKWLAENMQYPEIAGEEVAQGRVIVRFVVEKDGSIGKVEVTQGCHPILNKEAIRVVKSLPEKFTPAKKDGIKVRYWYYVPIDFNRK